jgi:hypothetical protein
MKAAGKLVAAGRAVVVPWLATWLATGLACTGSSAKILERLDGGTPPGSTVRVDVFLVRAASSCAVGPACTSPDKDQCFHVADGNGARVEFDPATLRFVPPGDPATMGGAGQQVQCFRLILDDGGVTAMGEALSALRTRVFQDSGGDINLDVRLHEVPAIDAGFSPFGTGLFLEPAAIAGTALPSVTRETDFVYAVTGAADPESGSSVRIDSCSGTNWISKAVIGGSAYTWMALSPTCDQDTSLIFSWLVQLYFGLRDVMQAPDIYSRDYPACGEGDPDTTRWFPYPTDCMTDPDFTGCGAAACANRDAFYTHLLARHWKRGEPFNGNHCSDGRMDRDETGVDTGGVCDLIGR